MCGIGIRLTRMYIWGNWGKLKLCLGIWRSGSCNQRPQWHWGPGQWRSCLLGADAKTSGWWLTSMIEFLHPLNGSILCVCIWVPERLGYNHSLVWHIVRALERWLLWVWSGPADVKRSLQQSGTDLFRTLTSSPLCSLHEALLMRPIPAPHHHRPP